MTTTSIPEVSSVEATRSKPRVTPQQLVERAQQLAAELSAAAAPLSPEAAFPRLHQLGLTTAPLPSTLGGVGLGSEPNTHLCLLQILAILGGADLSLGRLFEGHVNGILLVTTFATSDQLRRFAQDIHEGHVSGVWNTGSTTPLRLDLQGAQLVLSGNKTFASGSHFIRRPIVTAEKGSDPKGWQMMLLRLDATDIAPHLHIDDTSWQPLGMEASGSFTIDFSGAHIAPDDLLGNPGDFYRDPLFRGGAIRFAAVHAGAILRLHRLFAEWLDHSHRDTDPFQIARLGELTLQAQAAMLWVEQAATLAEHGLSLRADKFAAERVVEFANSMRLAVERLATAAMAIIVPGVGARGLMRPHRFEQILRDLTTYLRQPAPDQTLVEVGRATMRTLRLHRPILPWTRDTTAGSLSPAYFDEVYRTSSDPWSFETSPYEAGKYAHTVAALPASHFRNALEIGCSIGVLTDQLADRCDTLLSVDVSDTALHLARQRLATKPHVHFARLQFPRDIPPGCFDLVLVSEVGYYWQRAELEQAITALAGMQPLGGILVLVHLTESAPDYPLTGDQVHEAWIARPEWRVLHTDRRERYRLEVLERC